MITDLGPVDTVDIPDEWGDTVCRYAPTLNTAPVHPWVRVVPRGRNTRCRWGISVSLFHRYVIWMSV